jgi:hypothetical protein
MPTLRQLCHRGSYVSDSKQTRDDSACHKKSKGHKVLAPGLFTLACPHGKFHFSLSPFVIDGNKKHVC